MIPRLVLAAVLALGCVLVTGCGNARKRDVASLAAAVERFERARSEERPSMAPAVAAVPCTDPEVKLACDVCAKGTADSARALQLKAEVEQGLAAMKAGTLTREEAERTGLRDKLDEALGLVASAKTAMGDCDGRLETLKKSVGL